MKMKKCKCCKECFTPSPYNHKQEYCRRIECRKESHRVASKKNYEKNKNSEKFMKHRVRSTQQWRRKHPRYAQTQKKRKIENALSDIALVQKLDSFNALSDIVNRLWTDFKGFASITFGTLSDSFEVLEKEMYIRGQELSSGVDSKISNLKNKEFGHEQRINSCKS